MKKQAKKTEYGKAALCGAFRSRRDLLGALVANGERLTVTQAQARLDAYLQKSADTTATGEEKPCL